jgi:heme oxygenase (biliverdin-IX-beta and delta-forming)
MHEIPDSPVEPFCAPCVVCQLGNDGGRGVGTQLSLREASAPLLSSASRNIPTLHALLSKATRDTHNRLHGHEGFNAVQHGTIDRASYTKLLSRLYGFYKPFEYHADWGNARTTWLAQDLAELSVNAIALEKLPTCEDMPDLISPYKRLGAGYVVSGSALGGRVLARGLDHLLARGTTAGRRFFLGYGSQTGSVWQTCLARLDAAPTNPQTQSIIIAAAGDTFLAFERWMAGWKGQTDA